VHPCGQHRTTKLEVLRGIGRDLLSRFLYGFSDELAANQIELPGSQLGDTEFFTKIGDLFSGSVNLPTALTSTLTAIALMVACSGSSPLQPAHHRPPDVPGASRSLINGDHPLSDYETPIMQALQRVMEAELLFDN